MERGKLNKVKNPRIQEVHSLKAEFLSKVEINQRWMQNQELQGPLKDQESHESQVDLRKLKQH